VELAEIEPASSSVEPGLRSWRPFAVVDAHTSELLAAAGLEDIVRAGRVGTGGYWVDLWARGHKVARWAMVLVCEWGRGPRARRDLRTPRLTAPVVRICSRRWVAVAAAASGQKGHLCLVVRDG
jgi:hypothetical protein